MRCPRRSRSWARHSLELPLGIAVGVWQSGAGPRVDTALSIATVTLFRAAGILARAHARDWRSRTGALAPRIRRGRARHRRPPTGWRFALADRLRHFALPLATLTLIGVGGAARFVRGAMRDVMSQPFVMTAAAKGTLAVPGHATARCPKRVDPGRHAARALPPGTVSGAVFVEAVFAWPGVGRRLVEAVQARDYPVVMASTAVTALLVVAGNLLTTSASRWIDPRTRRERRDT